MTAAGTNPVDASNRADGSWAGIQFPHVPGYDVAGVIDAMGAGVTRVGVGDTVMAMTSFPRGAGGYAEFVVTSADLVATLEADVDLVAAAAVPLAAGTALEVLERLSLDHRSTLLVLGGSGGVGQFLLQLASHEGLRTIAVGGPSSHERMRDDGAAACIDYTTEDVAARTLKLPGGRVDAIADLVGGDQLARSLGALKPRGSAASIATPDLDLDAVLDNNIAFHDVSSTTTGREPGTWPTCSGGVSCVPTSVTYCPSKKRQQRIGSSSQATPAARSSSPFGPATRPSSRSRA